MALLTSAAIQGYRDYTKRRIGICKVQSRLNLLQGADLEFR